jgi:hypothetical protein
VTDEVGDEINELVVDDKSIWLSELAMADKAVD